LASFSRFAIIRVAGHIEGPRFGKAFDQLVAQFQVLHESLNATRRIDERDRPTVIAFADRVAAYSVAHPEHVGSVALELQLRIWLGEDDTRKTVIGEVLSQSGAPSGKTPANYDFTALDFYVHTARLEVQAHEREVSDWERARYFERI